MANSLDARIADCLKQLRGERGWSLDRLSKESNVSRATLSRLENADVSPTTEVLGRLCSAYGLTLTRLMMSVEQGLQPLIPYDQQEEWEDEETGFTRRAVSPPDPTLAAEVIEGRISPNRKISYDRPTRPGMEHHLVMLEGSLDVTVDGQLHYLQAGDCLRYCLTGPSLFQTPAQEGARYLMVLL